MEVLKVFAIQGFVTLLDDKLWWHGKSSIVIYFPIYMFVFINIGFPILMSWIPTYEYHEIKMETSLIHFIKTRVKTKCQGKDREWI